MQNVLEVFVDNKLSWREHWSEQSEEDVSPSITITNYKFDPGLKQLFSGKRLAKTVLAVRSWLI